MNTYYYLTCICIYIIIITVVVTGRTIIVFLLFITFCMCILMLRNASTMITALPRHEISAVEYIVIEYLIVSWLHLSLRCRATNLSKAIYKFVEPRTGMEKFT